MPGAPVAGPHSLVSVSFEADSAVGQIGKIEETR